MISWMQRHNKYLVVTIWIATIAFIGAGAVGWGSMNFGSSASSVGKVGDVYISKVKYAFTYNNLYAQYAQKYGSKFDRKTAKEIGLSKIVFNNLANEALLLNMANEFGIIVSDKEVADAIANYKLFIGKNGQIDKRIYENFVRNRGISKKDFENILRDELKVKKLLRLIDVKPLDFEKDIIKTTFLIGDKLKYKVITPKDVNVTVSDDEIKKYWEVHKNNYKTKKEYQLSLLWTRAKRININDDELKKYYLSNSFKFTDEKGIVKKFEDVKDEVKDRFLLEKIKKSAAIDRSKFKKGKIEATNKETLAYGDSKLPKEAWDKISKANVGDVLKPIGIKGSYVTIRIDKIIPPQVMKFDSAKELAKRDLLKEKTYNKMNKLAEKILKEDTKLDKESKGFISLSNYEVLSPLTPQNSLVAIKKIFADSKEKGVIDFKDSIFVYKITEQKILKDNKLALLDNESKNIKNNELIYNLIKELSKKYSITSYLKD